MAKPTKKRAPKKKTPPRDPKTSLFLKKKGK